MLTMFTVRVSFGSKMISSKISISTSSGFHSGPDGSPVTITVNSDRFTSVLNGLWTTRSTQNASTYFSVKEKADDYTLTVGCRPPRVMKSLFTFSSPERSPFVFPRLPCHWIPAYRIPGQPHSSGTWIEEYNWELQVRSVKFCARRVFQMLFFKLDTPSLEMNGFKHLEGDMKVL